MYIAILEFVFYLKVSEIMKLLIKKNKVNIDKTMQTQLTFNV